MKSKMIFISGSLADVSAVKEFAKKQGYPLEHFPPEEWNERHLKPKPAPDSNVVPLFSKKKQSAFETMDDLKAVAIEKALIISRGNASKAAGLLKIGRATLYRKIRELNFDLNSLRHVPEEDQSLKLLKKSA